MCPNFDTKINELLEYGKNKHHLVDDILDKAEKFAGLTSSELAILLQSASDDDFEKIFKISNKIKNHIYGNRIVMFAPLYISDYCVNKCVYCGFSHDCVFERRKLTMDEIKQEILELEKIGHKRLALEAGEDPVNCSIDYIIEAINTIYNVNDGAIRRVNVNIAATTVEEYKMLKNANIGTYILFQETYHKETYKNNHLKGPKSNFDFHSSAMDRAMEAGIDDVGGGVLFGLYDSKYEILGLMLHNEHLEQKFNVGFHTISVPRICETADISLNQYKHAVSDNEFKKIVSLIRMAVPFTGIIISTRETKEMREILINQGVSQLSAGSAVDVFGYTNRAKNIKSNDQFELADHRDAKEIISWLVEKNLIPSFCTACYRSGRTGDRFMQLAKSGNIKNVCLPNSLITLKEYALDYGDDELNKQVDKLISNNIANIKSEEISKTTRESLEHLKDGKRDFYV